MPLIAAAALALAVIAAGVLAVLDVGGVVADAGGLVVIVAAIGLLGRVAFRWAEPGS